MLDTILLIILLVIVCGLAAAVFLTSRKMQELKESHANDKSLLMLNQNLGSMNEKIDKTTDAINERLTNAARVIADVKKELGTVQERFKGFEEFNELLHPKLRGNIGEQILADMLQQVFSAEHYELQYKFKGGETVDAVLRTKAGLIPIDSKFPLENFKQYMRAENDDQRRPAQRDFVKAVKKHVDDISRKYLLPEEGTVNFGVMYVPSENVYYHILTDEESALMDYAKSKNVIMVSPHGFFSFLRIVMMGMERSKLQEQAQKIWDILKGVQQESIRFQDTLGVLGRHVTNAKNAMDTVQSGYDKLSGKLDQVKLLE